jgi:hypothetical protein
MASGDNLRWARFEDSTLILFLFFHPVNSRHSILFSKFPNQFYNNNNNIFRFFLFIFRSPAALGDALDNVRHDRIVTQRISAASFFF